MIFKQDREHLVKLWDLLCTHFNEEELKTFCFLLGEEYDNFGGQGAEAKTREIVLFFNRHGRIDELLRIGQQRRPDIAWDSIIDGTTKTNKIAQIKIYDSNNEATEYFSDHWKYYRFPPTTEPNKHIRFMRRQKDKLLTVELVAYGSEHVGANKYVRSLKGKIEFDYKIITTDASASNIAFYIIPMKPNEVEVGIDPFADPRLQPLSYRIKRIAPIKHFGSPRWYRRSIKYDFENISEAFYSIFAPRINEGFQQTSAAHLLISNIQIYTDR